MVIAVEVLPSSSHPGLRPSN